MAPASTNLGGVSTLADPRAEYRRRLRRRQTIVIGSLLSGMAVLTVVCFMIWSGVLTVPWGPGFSVAAPKETTAPQPCPPEDSVSVDLNTIPINVYNGSSTVGLATSVAETLREMGLTIGNTADWPKGAYDGDIMITTGTAGIANAYSLARIFSGDVIVQIDETVEPDDTTVSIVLGALYSSSLLSEDEIGALAIGEPLVSPVGCATASSTPSSAG